MSATWFESWFDSPYYHQLYNNHDTNEAESFLSELLQQLDPPKGSQCLDLACGKGRHSIYLAQQGLNVVGMDLSEQSIDHARQFEHEHLQFYSHDMRRPFHINYFDYVLNLFTSFGYFATEREHLLALSNMFNSLVPGGTLVIDYFNAVQVVKTLETSAKIRRDDLIFNIKKWVEDKKVVKNIRFTAHKKRFSFEERVALFEKEDFERMLQIAGFENIVYVGSYKWEPFEVDKAPRLIILAKKPA